MHESPDLRFGRFELEPRQRRLLHDGAPVVLGARAFDLLVALAARRDRVVSKSELLDLVWPRLVVEENNLQVQVSTLRKLLGPQVIATIPGRGYRFVAIPSGEQPPVADQLDTASSAQAPTGILGDVAPLTNLPADASPLFGREDELRELHALLATHRLVTIVGSGGIGKTSIGTALAHSARSAFEDGVWRVELAAIADPAMVIPAVASVLRISLPAGATSKSLANALGDCRVLILLDNCEHLAQGTCELAIALHRHSPNAVVLVTSQEPLRAPEEHLYRLRPLAVPAEASLEEARQAGAVALFEARARAADGSFALTTGNVAAVVDICRRLDGIALAIELAAARIPHLGVEGIRARLDERFRVLTGGSRLALRRHQTLRAALEWSQSLLLPDEQTVLRRLGAFAGSFRLDSAQHVAADEAIDEWAVLDHLGALVDKSLVAADTGDLPRYRLLETTRAFALEKLHEAGETDSILRRHAQAVLMVFEASRDDEYLVLKQERLERYLPDLDNARAALDWTCTSSGDAQMHIALAGALAWIWVSAGLPPEGLRRTQAAIAAIGPYTAPHLEARLRGSWAWLAHPIVGPEELEANARAVEIYRRLGDRRQLFVSLCTQARFQPYCAQVQEAESALEEAQTLLGSDWPPAFRAAWLHSLAFLRDAQGRFEEAMVLQGELQELAVALGDDNLVVSSLINLEQSAATLGRLEESVARNREILVILQRKRSLRRENEHFVLKNLYMALVQLGATDEALDVGRRAYPLLDKVGRGAEMLEPGALASFKRGRADDAARMMGRADVWFESTNVRRDPVEQQLRDTLVSCLTGAFRPDELSRLIKAGQTLSDEAAVRLALRD